ncbi:hypothetical protein GQ44DRAFT_759093 [Phaeosphaeriaceae sp. PMI808]|nr:hypothetical protein GQ44DRAFT_759093 [Phaeosphaeriaceae sp. PMI808]
MASGPAGRPEILLVSGTNSDIASALKVPLVRGQWSVLFATGWFNSFLHSDPVLSADASVQAWLDLGLLEPVLDLDFSAVDVDELANVSGDLSSGIIDSSPDASSLSVPIVPESDFGGGSVDAASTAQFGGVLQGPLPAITQWDIASPQAPNPVQSPVDIAEQTVQDAVQPTTTPDPLRITPVLSQPGSPSQIPRPQEAPPQPLPPAPRPFRCGQCTARFVGSRQLSDHERNKHKKYRCCNKEYKHYKNFWQHRQAKHLGVRYECNVELCDYSADNKWNLKRHKANKHGQ